MKAIAQFLLTSVLMALFFNNLEAQSSIGIRGGVGFYASRNQDVGGDYPETTENLGIGNHSAIAYEIGLSKRFALQPEIGYIQKTAKRSFDGGSITQKLDYIEAPLLAKLRFGSSDFRGYLVAGPAIGFAVYGETREVADGSEMKTRYVFDEAYGENDRKDNRFDFSAMFGGGIQYHLGIGSIVLDARGAYDFTDFYKYAGGGRPSGKKAALWEGVIVSLGYQFDLK